MPDRAFNMDKKSLPEQETCGKFTLLVTATARVFQAYGRAGG